MVGAAALQPHELQREAKGAAGGRPFLLSVDDDCFGDF
jgi:hypothetical protein